MTTYSLIFARSHNTVVLLLSCALLWGCSSSQKTVKRTRIKTKSPSDTIAVVTERNQRTEQTQEENPQTNAPLPEEKIPSEEWIESTEKTMGYKIQLTSTTSLDEATKRRDEFKELLEDETIDLTFDAPYYKLRVGNFTEKKLADEYRDTLQTKGFTEAWVVRDQITVTVRKKKDE